MPRYRSWKDRLLNPKPKPVGRPTSLTPEVQERICDLIRDGNYAVTACRAVGIAQSTYYRWKQLGEAGEAPYSEFLEAIDLAEAESEARLIDNVRDEKGGSRWLLSKRWNDRFGDKVEVEGSGKIELVVRYADDGE